jgi:tetratricopeptide (TPR) repeat protein
VSPNSHNAWNNIGDDYDRLAQKETNTEKQYQEYSNAIKGFGQSYAIKPNYADAYHNQANIFYKMGRLDLARNTYEMALSYNPALFQTLNTLIQLDLVEKDVVELEKHLMALQQLKPNDLETAYITAVAYQQIGETEKAKQIATILYQQFPNIAEIKNLYDSLNLKDIDNN